MQVFLYVLVASVGCFGLISCDRSANSSDQVNKPQAGSPQPSLSGSSVFDAVLPILRAKTDVPLRLPRYLATENETSPLYANVASASPSKYEIELGFTPDCSGGNVCHYGQVAGRRIKAGEGHARGKSIRLATGIIGYFVDATCGATCSDSTLTWDENGYRYTVALKAEKLETLKKVAESAIVK